MSSNNHSSLNESTSSVSNHTQAKGGMTQASSKEHSLSENSPICDFSQHQAVLSSHREHWQTPLQLGQIAHPNFLASSHQKNAQLLASLTTDPNRPLDDVPAPMRRHQAELMAVMGHDVFEHLDSVETQREEQDGNTSLPNWQLIASPALLAHLELLHVGGLIHLPTDFLSQFKIGESSKPTLADTDEPLLEPLNQLRLLDLSDINTVLQTLPSLTRYGIQTPSQNAVATQENTELLNDVYADDWHIILHPEQFDNGENSLATDLLACSVAVHVLKQCDTRKTINRGLSAEQMCHHVRSYVLSQCVRYPQFAEQYRQIRLFAGHIIFALYHLGLQTTVTGEGTVFANLSSRSTLFTHYPNVPSYYTTGWG